MQSLNVSVIFFTKKKVLIIEYMGICYGIPSGFVFICNNL